MSTQSKSIKQQLNTYLEGLPNIDDQELATRALDFINNHNQACHIWFSPELEDIDHEESILKGPAVIRTINCIDGRDPRFYRGREVASVKSDAALITLDFLADQKTLVPKSADINESLTEYVQSEFLEISTAHYDSTNPAHGCAAMQLFANAIKGHDTNLSEFLTEKELNLIIEGFEESAEIGNLVLLKLTNNRAFANFYNQQRRLAGLTELNRVGITALYDTATMGLEIRLPIIDENLNLVKADKRQILATTDFAKQIIGQIPKEIIEQVGEFGSMKKTFVQPTNFIDYSQKVLTLTKYLLDSKSKNKSVQNILGTITGFIELNLADLTKQQIQALTFYLIRTTASQYLTGLAEVHGHPHHPFSEHQESWASVSKHSDYVGKYSTMQSFRIHAANAAAAAKRINIASSVMDKTGVDGEKQHLVFICNSVNYNDWASHNAGHTNKAYLRARSENSEFFRGILPQISSKMIPIPVLVDDKTGKVLEILHQQQLYLIKDL